MPGLEAIDPIHLVKLDSKIRVTLLSGERVSGTVHSLTGEELVLGDRGNYGHEDVVVAFADIRLIEVRDQSDAVIERAWFVGLALGLVAGVITGLRQMGGS